MTTEIHVSEGDTSSASGNRVVGQSVCLVLALTLWVVALGVGVGPAVADEHTETKEVVGNITAVGTDGIVAVNADSPDDPIPLTPEGVDRPIVIEGQIFADGTWESTNVTFTDLNPETVDVPTRIELESAGPFTGEIDREAGLLTANGTLRVIVPAADEQIDVTATLTTEQSGSLDGVASGLDTGTGTATVVDNRFTLAEATGDSIIDSVIGLPSPEPGRNWFELTLDVGIESRTGTVAGTVESPDGDPVEGATVSTTVGTRETTTDADGSYELEAPAGSNNLTVQTDEFATTREPVTVTPGGRVTGDVELDPPRAVFEPVTVLASDGSAGETLTVTGFVQNTGVRGTREVTLSVAGQSVTESLELAPGELGTVVYDWEATTDDVGTEAAVLEVGDRTARTAVSVAGPELDVSLTATNAAPGETVTVNATVRNTGTVGGRQNVTLSIADQSTAQTVEIGAGDSETVTLEWQTSAEDNGSFDAVATVGGQTVRETVRIQEDVGEEADFVARSTGGYMTYDEPSYDVAEGTGLSFPDLNAGQQPIVIAGQINEDGTWESTDTFFPDVTQEGLTGQVRAPNGLTGRIDREEGLLTASGLFRVFVQEAPGTSFEFNLTMTTADSGEAVGAIPGGGTYESANSTFASINFVSNDYAVTDQTGDGLVDSTLSLPSPEPNRNYMELGFDVDFDPGDVEVQQQEGINDTAPETGANGTLFATLGQGVGGIGLVAGVLFVLAGLYARVGRE